MFAIFFVVVKLKLFTLKSLKFSIVILVKSTDNALSIIFSFVYKKGQKFKALTKQSECGILLDLNYIFPRLSIV